MAKQKIKRKQSKREQSYKALLNEALQRPGVYEVMQVYQNWQQADSGLDAYRLATKEAFNTTTTDHSNAE